MGTKLWHIAIFVAAILAIAAIMHPTNFRTAWMYMSSGKIHEAVEKLTTLYEKNPKNYRTIKLLAQALEEQGKVEEAEKLYEQLLTLKPRDDNYQDLVRFYTWTEQPEKVFTSLNRWYDFRKAQKISFADNDGRDLIDNLFSLCMLYQDYDRAIEVTQTRATIEPQQLASIQEDLVALYEMSGNITATAKALEQLLTSGSAPASALEALMEIASQTRQTTFVKDLLRAKIEASPKDADAWQKLIDFETTTGDLVAAEKQYRQWVGLDPQNDQRRQRYIAWLLENDQQKTAMAQLEATIRSGATDPFYTNTLAQLYEWNGNEQQLIPIYRARFEQNPRDRNNAKKLLWLIINRKQYAEAEKILTRLLAQNPRDQEYAKMLIDLYDAQKRSDKALAELEKIAPSSNDPKLLKRLGEHYLWGTGKDRAP